MDEVLITQEGLTTMSSNNNKSFILENLNTYYDELIIDNVENNERIVNLLSKKMANNKRFSKIDENNIRLIAQTGLSCLSDVIKTFNLKDKKDNLQARNRELEDLFFQKYEEKLSKLKEKVKKNQEDFKELQNNAETMSLGQLANNINEFHNPNASTDVSNQDIEDLLNGGTLEF